MERITFVTTYANKRKGPNDGITWEVNVEGTFKGETTIPYLNQWW